MSELFPPGAVAATLQTPGDPDLLFDAEAGFVGQAVLKRRQEFAAGRVCARRALVEFGVMNFAVQVASDRQPVWPADIVGSITHTEGFCAAVVAQRGRVQALGIDTEQGGRVKPELWPRICSAESDWLQQQPEYCRSAAATLIFCAKEAFYKCQYSLAQQWLGFEDVRVEVLSWGAAGGGFQVHARRPLVLAQHAKLPLQGRYLFHDGFITAGVSA